MFARRFLRVLLSLLVGLIALAVIGAALNPVARAATTTVNVPAQSARSISAPVNTVSTCVTLQRGTRGSVADAYIWAAYPNTNGGNSDYLHTGLVGGGEKRSLLRFDLSVIPAGSVPDSANLSVHLTSTSGQTVRVHAITSTWSETGVTWNNFGNSFAPEATGTFTSDVPGSRSADVTALVQAWLSDTPNYGLLLEETPSDSTTYKSSEHGDSAHRPRLEICYHPVTTVRVYPNVSPCDTTLQACIDGSAAGDVIQIKPGTYTTSVTLYKPVNLIGAGANQTIIHAAAADRVLTVTGPAITSTTVISGLTFSNGQPATAIAGLASSQGHPAAMGGGILITGLAAPTLVGVQVRDNRAVMGGGLYIDTGGATLIDSQVISNTAEQSGGGAYVAQLGAFLEVSHSLIISNTAVDGAGVFVQDGQFRAAGFSYLIGNHASNWGGGVLIGGAGGRARIDASRLALNTADIAGGGVLVDTGRFELIGGTILSNTSNLGGGVYLSQPTAVFTQAGGTVDGNTADYGGGYYLNDGRVNLLGGAVSNNRAGNGAGVYVATGETRLLGTALITGNIADAYGGGVYLSSSDAKLTQWGGSIQSNAAPNGGGVKITKGEYALWAGQVLRNAATDLGGGVLLYSAGARFTQYGGSIAENAAGWGGGLFVQAGRVNLIDGRIISNTADLSGGGVEVDAAGQLYVTGQSRIADNEARGGDGGGVHVRPDGQAVFVGGRVESNKTQGFGGGLYAQSGLTISGTRFLDNAARDGYAIYHTGGEAGYVVNALIADNHGPAANWNGASVSLDSTGQTQLVFSTLANSANSSGRAIDVRGGGLSLVNSIVASYSVGISRTAGAVIEDYNLFFGNGISLTGAITLGVHTRDGLDPQFVDPTVDDYHIRQTSPAINKAIDVGVRRDFDFDARPIGGGYDVGADETQGAGATIPPGVITTTTVLSYTAPNGGVTSVFIPSGAVSGTVTDTVSFYYTVISTDSITTPLPVHLTLSGDPFELDAFTGNEFTATQIVTFNTPVTITIHYTETELNGISEQTLKLYRLETPPFGTGWYAIGYRPTESQTLDTANNIITATVTGFSRWGRAGAEYLYELFLPVVFRQ